MRTQPLRPLLEALAATTGNKNLAGEVTSADKLFKSDALAKLDGQHHGVFALLLFNNKLDESVATYLTSGSIGNDTGTSIFVLYEGSPRSRWKSNTAGGIPGVVLSDDESPMVAFARDLFPNRFLVLPGVIVVERLESSTSALFVALDTGESGDLVTSIRKLWAMIDEAWKARTSHQTFDQSLGIRLAKGGFEYQRSEGISPKEKLFILLRVLWESRRDLIALVPVFGKIFSTKAVEKPTTG